MGDKRKTKKTKKKTKSMIQSLRYVAFLSPDIEIM